MSDNWVVQNLQNTLGTWNEKLAEIWTLLTQSPKAFKGGAIWNVIVNIHGALQAIGIALLVLFFLVGVVKTCGSFAEVKKPEMAVKLFIRFAIAKGVVTYGLELMMAIFDIVQGMISTIMKSAGVFGNNKATLPKEMINAIEDCGFFESIPLWAVTLIGSLVITVLSFIMILTVYGRFFNHINAMDLNREYGDGANPVILKSEFVLSLCEQLIGNGNLGAKQKSIIDRCTARVYWNYQENGYTGLPPTLQDFHAELMMQPEPEAKELALAIELFTKGSLNTFAKHTNVDTNNRLICFDILDLGKQLMPIGMLVVLDSILNRITRNRAQGRQTFIFIDEIYVLFQHEYSANFLFTLWKRVRKYGAFCTGLTQNVEDLLQSHTARAMLANSEFLIMLNQAPTDKHELAKLINISNEQMNYITDVNPGCGLIKVGSSLVPFENKFPRNTSLYKLMTSKPGEAIYG